MFQPIPVFDEDIFAFRITGKITKKDYEAFKQTLMTLIHKYGPLSLLLDLKNMSGLEAGVVWEDLKFASQHDKDFKKIAIIGDRKWEKWLTVLTDALTTPELRFFEAEETSEALDWLRGIERPADEQDKDEITPYRRILVATDFSPHSVRALQRAKELATRYGASMTIIHVIEPLINYESDYFMITPLENYADTEEIMYKNAQSTMEQQKKELGLEEVNSEIIWGTPKETILTYAEAQRADLIVMGSHGRRGLARLIGSTTNGVINRAKCEVLSVPL